MRHVPVSATDREFHTQCPHRRFRLRAPRAGELDDSDGLLTLDDMPVGGVQLIVLVSFRSERIEHRVYRVATSWVAGNLSQPPVTMTMIGDDPLRFTCDRDAIALALAHVSLDQTIGIRVRHEVTTETGSAA